MTNQQKIIETALAATKKVQDICLKQMAEGKISEQEAEKYAANLVEGLDCKKDLDMQVLMEASQRFTNHLLGSHKRNMAAVQYSQLNDLAKLTLDNYVIFAEEAEKLLATFMGKLNPILSKRFEESLIPALHRKLDEKFADNDSDEASWDV